VSWPIYSERLLSSGAGTGWHYYYVPAGKRAVVRHVSLGNPNHVAGYVQVAVGGASVWAHSFQGPEDAYALDVRWTAYAGEAIQAYTGESSHTVQLNGFLFEDRLGARARAPETGGPSDEMVPDVGLWSSS